jgi:hypothetical protein
VRGKSVEFCRFNHFSAADEGAVGEVRTVTNHGTGPNRDIIADGDIVSDGHVAGDTGVLTNSHVVPNDCPLPNASGWIDDRSRSDGHVGSDDAANVAGFGSTCSVSDLNTASQHGSRLDDRVVANRDQGAENGSGVQYNVVADVTCVPDLNIVTRLEPRTHLGDTT